MPVSFQKRGLRMNFIMSCKEAHLKSISFDDNYADTGGNATFSCAGVLMFASPVLLRHKFNYAQK